MKKLLAALLFLCAVLSAQDPTVTIRVKAGAIERLWSFILRQPVTLVSMACDATELEPGDSSVCTVTLSRPAKATGFVVSIAYPPELSGPVSVTVQAGSTTATFKVLRPIEGYTAPGTNSYIGAVTHEYRPDVTITRASLHRFVTP